MDYAWGPKPGSKGGEEGWDVEIVSVETEVCFGELRLRHPTAMAAFGQTRKAVRACNGWKRESAKGETGELDCRCKTADSGEGAGADPSSISSFGIPNPSPGA